MRRLARQRAAPCAYFLAAVALAAPAAWAGPAPVAATSASATVTSSSPASMHFPLTRSGDSAYAAWISYATQDGTALAGTDYSAASGAVQVPAGATGASIPVQILGASSYAADKQFTLKLLGAAGIGPTPSFTAQQAFATGSGPLQVTAADINGDGRPDLIVVNKSANTVSVLLNTTAPGATTPTFAAQQTFTVGTAPYSVTVADINGDGKPDLIVADSGAINYNVSLLLNTTAPGAATASFATPQTLYTGSAAPQSVAAADVNGDGKPDLIVAASGSNNVTVMLNGTATGAMTASFPYVYAYAVGSGPASVTVADVNGDGRPDLIVANQGSSTVSVLLNQVTPGAIRLFATSFSAQQTFITGGGPLQVTTADINGDGKPDLIVANYANGSVVVLLNTTAPGATSASFAAAQTLSTTSNSLAVTAADVNGDGKPDVIVTSASGIVSVLLNTTVPGAATASFAARQNFTVGSAPYSVTVTEVNGDGKPDLVVANYGNNTVSVLLSTAAAPGASSPSFAAQQTFATGTGPDSVTTADINGDGKPDIIVANKYDNTVSVLLNTTAPGATTPSFAAQQTFATGTGTGPYSVTTADVNGDGRPDLIVANNSSGTVSVLLNSTAPGAATASFVAQLQFAVGSAPYSVAAADVNGDGRPDLIVANRGSGTVSVLLNQVTPGVMSLSSTSFAAQQTFATGTGNSVTTADINGDGKPDLIVANNASSGTVSVLLDSTAPGAATATFAAQQTFAVGSFPYSVTTADINGDGRPDLIVANEVGNTVSVLMNTTAPGATTPSFAAQQTFTVGSAPYSVTAADVSGDGKPDLIVADSGGNNVSVLPNTTVPGAATASSPSRVTFPAGSLPASVTAADVNGDGTPDLIIANASGKTVSVLLNTQYAVSVSPASVSGTIHYAFPEAAFSPDPLAFGSVAVGGSSTMTVTLSNNGGGSLTISSIGIKGTDAARFSQTNNCPGSLAVGANCAVRVTFTPDASTTDTAALSVSTNEATSPDSVALSGIGTKSSTSMSSSGGGGGGAFGLLALGLLLTAALAGWTRRRPI